jgi:hypothetical protein
MPSLASTDEQKGNSFRSNRNQAREGKRDAHKVTAVSAFAVHEKTRQYC